MSERKGTRALELWCKRLVRDCPNVQIENMTTSWRNGLAFCALVHHFRPDLIDVSSLKPENIYENNQLAFSLAEKHLGIPALLDPEDMVANEVPDRLSVLTYLSQFYQRLGHTVNTKVNDNDSSQSGTSPNLANSQPSALTMFGKAGLDKCAACDLPVYLAQRLIVAQKLYHRRCFRCSKCSGHLNPHSFKNFVGTEFVCDTCKTDKVMSKFLNNNDVQMGMLAFTDSLHEQDTDSQVNRPVADKQKSRPQSIIDKINMFEKNFTKEDISNKLDNVTLKESNDMPPIIAPGTASTSQETINYISPEYTQIIAQESMHKSTEIYTPKKTSENLYKSDEKKYAFLKTQLQGDTKTDTGTENDIEIKENFESNEKESINDNYSPKIELKEECNVTDDTRLAKSVKPPSSDETSNDLKETEKEANISIPPRRKKRILPEKVENVKDVTKINKIIKEYPDHLNPFSEDEEEDENPVVSKKESLNPFGSSDEEEDEVPPIATATTTGTHLNETPTRRLISANPFWSDDEEPSTDEDDRNDTSSSMFKSSMTTSTPNLHVSTPHRKKARAPPPPPTITVSALTTSMDDVASISSVSSYNSTVHSDQKCQDKLTPLTLRNKRPAPTPPDSISTLSEGSRDLQGGGGSTEKEGDSIESGGWRHTKRPAPGLPLPSRREVKLQMSPEDLQVQLELLETQQMGLERQGVLIEQMIRDKCEGDEAIPVPQEEVEDLVIQLCELVNEKNDLFRKQTELMYIRRQQRLEQEQADIEHEIRVIQSRPAVNRIDADKAREEQLVSRLVEIVRLRDELVQSLDAERRRERQEDLAIAASIASKRATTKEKIRHQLSSEPSSNLCAFLSYLSNREANSIIKYFEAQRNSESNSSSLKSVEVVVPKKSKVKDKMKKQLKKAKHTFIHSKKKESSEKKHDEKCPEKENKPKATKEQ